MSIVLSFRFKLERHEEPEVDLCHLINFNLRIKSKLAKKL